MNQVQQEPTLHDILRAINTMSTHVDEQISDLRLEVSSIRGDMTSVQSQMAKMQLQMAKMQSEIADVHSEITEMRSQMVTKDYLDEKMADLRGDLVVLVRKEDRKVAELISILQKKDVLTQEESDHLRALEPFAPIAKI